MAAGLPVPHGDGPGRAASVAFWYAEEPPVAELAQFDWVVLEPGHANAADVRALHDGGAQPFAYLSIGEFAGDAAALEKAGSARVQARWPTRPGAAR